MSEAAVQLSLLCPRCGVRYAPDSAFCPKDGAPLLDAAPIAVGERPNAAPPPSVPLDPYVGRVILDHIEIREAIGSGAMGKVYRAFQSGIDRDVAVKILHRELSANRELSARFDREAKVASRISHPNVVNVYLAGHLADDSLYIVMEHLEGPTLGALLRRPPSAASSSGNAPGKLPLERALRIILQICDAVGEGHVQGVVHRDLKPDNVMLVRRGTDDDFVKVLDFGIARLTATDNSDATAAGLIFGTARYISPEGARGEAATPASDVYAIATLLYQMLCGRTPFDGEQAVGILVRQIHDAPPPLDGDVPAPLAAVILRNLAKDPAERDADARALGRSLLTAARDAHLGVARLVGRTSLLDSLGFGDALSPLHSPAPPSTEGAPSADTRTDGRPSTTLRQTPADVPDGDRGTRPLGTFPVPHGTVKMAPTASPILRSAQPAPALSLDERSPLPNRTVPLAVAVRDVAPELSANSGSSEGLLRQAGGVVSPLHGVPLPAAEAPVDGGPADSRGDADEDPDLDASIAGLPSPGRGRRALIVALCFLVGSAVTLVALGYRYRYAGADASESDPREELVVRARAALDRGHFDEPKVNNVREITDEGLRRFPDDARFRQIRESAAADLLNQARTRLAAGDRVAAKGFAERARTFGETDETKKFFGLLEGAPAPSASAAASGPTPHTTVPLGTAPAGIKPQASFQVEPAAPRVSGPVTLTVRVVVGGKPFAGTVADPSFTLVGAGGKTRLPAENAGAGVFRATYTFFDRGPVEATFSATLDGARVTPARRFAVEAAGGSGTAPTPTASPTPSGSAKWL